MARSVAWFAASLVVAVGLSAAAWAEADVAAGRAAFERGDYGTAARLWRAPAESGDPEAQFALGVLCTHAKGVMRDYRQAAMWYERAARQGHEGAQFALGFMYYTGAGGPGDEGTMVAADPGLAARWLLLAAENGVAMAQHLVGGMLRRGVGMPADPERAFGWTLRAANKGVVGAQYDAGLILSQRQGGRYDPIEGYKWFALAAQRGYPGARHNLGVMAEAMSAEDLARAMERVRLWRPE